MSSGIQANNIGIITKIPAKRRVRNSCSTVRQLSAQNPVENDRLIALIDTSTGSNPKYLNAMEKVGQFGLAPSGNVPVHRDEITGGEDAYRKTVVDFVRLQGYDTVLTLSTFRSLSYEMLHDYSRCVFRKLNIKPCLQKDQRVHGRLYIEHQPSNSHFHVLLRFDDERLRSHFKTIFYP